MPSIIRAHQLSQVCRLENDKFSHRERAQRILTNTDSNELQYRTSNGLAHPSDLAILAFRDRQFEPGVLVRSTNFSNNRGAGRLFASNIQAKSQIEIALYRHRTANFHIVSFGNL